MQSFKNRTVAALGAVVATFATVAAASPARAETSQQVVSYAGLDLGSTAGQAALDRRIHVAAAKVCGPMNHTAYVQILACRSDAVASARASLPESVRRTQLASR